MASDLARTPNPRSIALERHLPARAGLGAEFRRVLRVRPGPAAGLALEMREEFPASFEVRARSLPGEPGSAAPANGDPTGGPDRARLSADGSELDLRSMMASAMGLRKDIEPGRWVVETLHESRPWEVIVEPDPEATLLVVITAYPLGTP